MPRPRGRWRSSKQIISARSEPARRVDLAADLLAPDKPLNVTVIGSGFQASTQLEACEAVRTVSRVRVWSRSQTRREHSPPDTGADVATSAEQACEGADVIVTATTRKILSLTADAIDPRCADSGDGIKCRQPAEVPAEVVERARIVVDDVEQCRIEAGDLLLAEYRLGRGGAVVGNRQRQTRKPAEIAGSRFSNLSGLLSRTWP